MMIDDVNSRVRAHKKRKRVGRGNASGHGTTAGRGTKGFKSRSGSRGYRLYEGGQTPLAMHLPKRGFKNPCRREYAVVNIENLARHFKPNDVITPELLKRRGIVKDLKDGLKVLGDGRIDFALTVKAHRFSKKARQMIEEAGGVVVELRR